MSAADDVHAVIDDMVARGVFVATPVAARGAALLTWRIKWFSGHEMWLSAKDNEINVDEVLPRLAAQSQLYRDLRAWLKAQQSSELSEHRRIDPKRVKLTLKNTAGQLRLSLRSDCESLPALATRAVKLVHALYLDFLNGPGRLEWVIEAFGLDPDNPRFS